MTISNHKEEEFKMLCEQFKLDDDYDGYESACWDYDILNEDKVDEFWDGLITFEELISC